MVAARALATYLIPGCVGRGVRLGSECSSGAGGGGVWKSGNLEIWESGNLEILGPGNPEIWRSGDLEIQKFGVHKIKKIKILKIQIRSAQNVGKVWISRNKFLLAPFGAIPGHFVHGPEKCKQCCKFAYFPWWANGPYSLGLGSYFSPAHLCISLRIWTKVHLSMVHISKSGPSYPNASGPIRPDQKILVKMVPTSGF